MGRKVRVLGRLAAYPTKYTSMLFCELWIKRRQRFSAGDTNTYGRVQIIAIKHTKLIDHVNLFHAFQKYSFYSTQSINLNDPTEGLKERNPASWDDAMGRSHLAIRLGRSSSHMRCQVESHSLLD